jgi:hypothetical protein
MENASSAELVREQSHGMCEALLQVQPQIWARCGIQPVEVHHRLPRSHGGLLLDEIIETYHLLALCRKHHEYAHKNPEQAYMVGLLLHGSVLTSHGHLVYSGDDPFLMRKYGQQIPPRMRTYE